MNTIIIELIFAGLFVSMQFGNTGTLPEKTVSQLILDSTDNFGLVNYFKELSLAEHCKSQIIDVNNFNRFMHVDAVPCLCTVIYNMTKELEHIVFNVSDVNIAKDKTNNYKYDDQTMYKTWKNVTNKSPSLKLLMEPLNIDKWNKLCYDYDNVIVPYCKFLNVEVLLLRNTLQIPKESIKEAAIVVSKSEKGNVPDTSHVLTPKEHKKSDDLIEVDGSLNEYTGDVQKAIDDANTIESSTFNEISSNKEDENNNEDELEKPMKDVQTDSKINLKSIDDYPQEDNFIPPNTEKKEEKKKMFNQKNILINHEFGDVDDSHFLFYFAIMTVLSMLFYLALYNKKKIIALLIEGRRSTNHRRRPNTASYSKVETDEGSTVF